MVIVFLYASVLGFYEAPIYGLYTCVQYIHIVQALGMTLEQNSIAVRLFPLLPPFQY